MTGSLRVVLAGGGTAGHTSPLIATAQALQRLTDVHLSCIGTPRGLETTVIPQTGLELDLIDPVPMPRRPGADLAKVPLRLGRAVHQARRILQDRRAEVLTGFGGYVSMPAYLAARSLGIPVVIHEQNALPGLANKVAARFATAVATSFPDTVLPGARFIGLPVRTEIRALAQDATPSADQARAALGLDPDRMTLLVSGGSQGARSINRATTDARDRLLAAGVQVLHVWGPKNLTADHVEVTDQTTGARYLPVGYVDGMEQAYAAADLMLGRSGAGTVVETAVVGLPGVFVPLPHGNGEQARNAVALVAAGAARVVPDDELGAQRLLDEVLPLLAAPERLAQMSAAGRQLMSSSAADELARLVISAAAGAGSRGRARGRRAIRNRGSK
ncbi:undecaprenyldiphospho-muramoylpentapeptide beta-N-acetylglucosaminyltransferase [Tessaracoccus sp. SD287]|uniref:undecaprenyldiphospho-muramoylpentapeptide beta-N-acetylglucosaminyltransferase n=1 Tax=Tessaracoccus sp. SD287 TaxID=2782008 RepID=UPI001A95CB35|nr:undecaprenyldiphospho-muramoylpentapeptide beta-N-acetylglucosaminyltransferase [Tessaracoccus sp. SD287]MBO1031573.1 undecaprenyldiphospho-muramoylpentapeptide beta-N-acetylglucosaminyltransferase [Tessaracoccus sp. SD287]